ncbi:MAG: hypothetical protein MHMPM18_001201 [Marteilia pararefringens]
MLGSWDASDQFRAAISSSALLLGRLRDESECRDSGLSAKGSITAGDVVQAKPARVWRFNFRDL